MALNQAIAQAIEKLRYRATAGDVAVQAGLNINLTQQGLLVLAADVGGHLQVAESGEIVYLFPPNFRSILRNKFWQLRWQEFWQRIWQFFSYLMRISFGIVLVISIVLIFVTIFVIIVTLNSSRGSGDNNNNNNDGGSGGGIFLPHFWFNPNLFWFFDWDYHPSTRRQKEEKQPGEMNFLEAVFSFLFGDGDPNFNLEERRWQAIAATIRYHQGAVVAEQIAPYLDDLGTGYSQEYEDYMLPILVRFEGRPEVNPEGQIIYHFPELQVTASASESTQPVLPYLKEKLWQFSQANFQQIMLAVGLGAVNIIGALILGSLLADGKVALAGGLVAFVSSIYWFLLAYGIAFLAIPLIRYFLIQRRNTKIAVRNEQRQARASLLAPADEALQKKIAYAESFAAQSVISNQNLAYTTETDLLPQEIDGEVGR